MQCSFPTDLLTIESHRNYVTVTRGQVLCSFSFLTLTYYVVRLRSTVMARTMTHSSYYSHDGCSRRSAFSKVICVHSHVALCCPMRLVIVCRSSHSHNNSLICIRRLHFKNTIGDLHSASYLIFPKFLEFRKDFNKYDCYKHSCRIRCITHQSKYQAAILVTISIA